MTCGKTYNYLILALTILLCCRFCITCFIKNMFSNNGFYLSRLKYMLHKNAYFAYSQFMPVPKLWIEEEDMENLPPGSLYSLFPLSLG